MTNLVLDKVAWVRVNDEGRVLVARNHGRDVYYFPGGRRELGETDVDTLLREVAEELSVAVLAATASHFGTYEIVTQADAVARMTCYLAGYEGILTPDNEIAEMAWMTYADRARVSPLDQLVFDDLRARGHLD
jgi:8-oxo-dGTP pyrophosphatase MutT (NUDIX family)